MTVIQVSQRELSRLRVMIDLSDGRLTVSAAGELMGIGRRQVFRLCRAFEGRASGIALQEARTPEQPPAWRRLSPRGYGPGARNICRFRTDPGRGEAGRAAWSATRRGDTAAMDDRRWPVDRSTFGRSLLELNIDIICAVIPQAKGRVERAFGTLQDRLVKELRLANIASIDAANAWL
jgi:hypothetical protein